MICHEISKGGEEGLRELAVLKDGKLYYGTPITEDMPDGVLGNLTDDEVVAACLEIASY